ncbi:C40 family peptidase [Herbaspirillum sp. LeCh32-8]|uniref:C40 family peptidase n=1 Tax=Herbaspirillum sp. LeCh32-8 TaxID=2821356 RepID=UPI001AE452A9|nr:C40 family peptidase [Herbaspirillum sp. LeCh32-8]MBP0599264.1 C40 family peptidase [Herbaspirillum sp. LeCh32-8]
MTAARRLQIETSRTAPPSSLPFLATRRAGALAALTAALALAACSTAPTSPQIERLPGAPQSQAPALPATDAGNEVAIYALSLIDTGYRFGGKNPSAGLDCSGMVSYIFGQAANYKVSGSAADIARQGRQIDPGQLRAGDLVFFNTMNKPFSHVGIYLGDGRFVHAPSTNGKVHITRMDNPYFAKRFEMARSYFN